MITPNGNFGPGGVLTGQAGSVRSPRVLAASPVGANDSITDYTTLPPQRFINDRNTPLFVTGISVVESAASQVPNLELETGTAPAFSVSTAQITTVNVDIEAAGFELTRQPTRIAATFEPGGLNTHARWNFAKPFVLFPGEGFIISTNAGPQVTFAVHGYYESNPVPQAYRYIPYTLYDEAYIDASGGNDVQASLRAEALRNSGDLPFHMTEFFTLATRAKVRGNGFDWMVEHIDVGAITGVYHAPLFGAVLGPEESLDVELEVASGTAASKNFYFAATGYKVVPLKVGPTLAMKTIETRNFFRGDV